jgi:hypothetical protein
MFDAEYLLNLIGTKLGLSVTPYGNFVDTFLRYLDMADENTTLTLKSPAYIRNSLHNNGYASKLFNLIVGGKRYEFLKGEQVYYSGWDNLYLMFDKLTDTIADIINHPKGANIDKIPHQFMRQRA